MNILFVCSANIDRSRTAEAIFTAKFPEHNFKSAGTNQDVCKECHTTLVDRKLLDWADHVFVMEKKHLDFLQSLDPDLNDKEVEVLDIPDDYKYLNAKLIAILDEKVHF